MTASWTTFARAEARVLKVQTKLHQWAADDPNRRFDDLYNLVYDPAFLVVAWNRVKGNRGARSAGVDGVKPSSVVFGDALLARLRAELKARPLQPMPVRERLIPKAHGKVRMLGIATARDRVVQASLKLVLEPIFEADFKPASYGFRPKRRAQDAIAEINFLASRSYEWVLEGDIKACFDEISHVGIVSRLRRRIGDKRVVNLVKAFLHAGILGEDGRNRKRSPAPRKGGSSHPCSPTSRSPFSTNTSPRRGKRWATSTPGPTGVARDCPLTASSATRTTSWCWWPEPATTPRVCAPKWNGCSRRWACACRKRRRGSCTSTRASTFSAGASSVSRSEAAPNATSTPTRRRRRCSPSATGCGR